jgi:hypothetical protein
VTLTVADEDGLEDQASTIIQVNEPPDLFPIFGNSLWVYHVRSTKTENGKVSGQEQGTMYLVATDYREEDGIDYMTLRITGKRWYNNTFLGDYIYLTHDPGNALMVSHKTDEPAKALINLNEST